MSTRTWKVIHESHGALRTVIVRLDPAAWTRPTPCSEWNISQVLRHAAGDQRAYAAAITGRGGPTENQFAPADEPPAEPEEYVEAALTCAAEAFASVPAGTSSLPTPWPGEMPADLVAAACALDCVIHAWDIAVAVGRPSPLTATLASALAATAPVYVEPLRSYYAPPLEPRSDDNPSNALLRYLGRDPGWLPPPASGR